MVFRIVLVQRQLENVRVASNEWVLFWLRFVLRVSLAWRSLWSRAARIASSLPGEFGRWGDVADRIWRADSFLSHAAGTCAIVREGARRCNVRRSP
jgi:hypothetical protein